MEHKVTPAHAHVRFLFDDSPKHPCRAHPEIQEYWSGQGMTDGIEQGCLKIEQKIFDNFEAEFTFLLFL